MSIDLDLPDGRTVHTRCKLPTAQFRAAKERCDVRIGDNRFTGDLHAYSIQATIEDVRVDVTLTGSTARPQSIAATPRQGAPPTPAKPAKELHRHSVPPHG
ncbi:MAG: hypothetical protein ACLP1X_25005 [Polyangiaceae bacterium]